MEKSAITAASLTCMTGVSWRASRIRISPTTWQFGRSIKHSIHSLHAGGLILHSDRGSQYTSKAFVEFCEAVHVSQSMSKAGYSYDNAPMERYFNTLKNECTNLYEFRTEADLYEAVEEFAYVHYNHVRPHSYNGYRTPYQARKA